MNYLICALVCCFVWGCSSSDKEKNSGIFKTEQLYKGYSTNGNYLCYMKISPDNRILFTYETKGNYVYGEHAGTIKAINDTLFRVSCELTFGQFVCKAPELDSLMIMVDPPSLIDKKSILVQYENEDLMTKHRIDPSGITFTFDPNLYNEHTPARILTDHMHPITGNALTIKASFGSGYDFVRGDKMEFNVVISGDSIYTVNEEAAFQTGPIKLKKLTNKSAN